MQTCSRWAVPTVLPLRSFVSGRVALLGDAVSPVSGCLSLGLYVACLSDCMLYAWLVRWLASQLAVCGRLGGYLAICVCRHAAICISLGARYASGWFTGRPYPLDSLPGGLRLYGCMRLAGYRRYASAWLRTWKYASGPRYVPCGDGATYRLYELSCLCLCLYESLSPIASKANAPRSLALSSSRRERGAYLGTLQVGMLGRPHARAGEQASENGLGPWVNGCAKTETDG